MKGLAILLGTLAGAAAGELAGLGHEATFYAAMIVTIVVGIMGYAPSRRAPRPSAAPGSKTIEQLLRAAYLRDEITIKMFGDMVERALRTGMLGRRLNGRHVDLLDALDALEAKRRSHPIAPPATPAEPTPPGMIRADYTVTNANGVPVTVRAYRYAE